MEVIYLEKEITLKISYIKWGYVCLHTYIGAKTNKVEDFMSAPYFEIVYTISKANKLLKCIRFIVVIHFGQKSQKCLGQLHLQLLVIVLKLVQ